MDEIFSHEYFKEPVTWQQKAKDLRELQKKQRSVKKPDFIANLNEENPMPLIRYDAIRAEPEEEKKVSRRLNFESENHSVQTKRFKEVEAEPLLFTPILVAQPEIDSMAQHRGIIGLSDYGNAGDSLLNFW